MSKQQENPKILHRIYFENFKPFHDPFLHYLDSWRREMPDYEIKLWGPHNLDVDTIPWTRIASEKKSPVFLSEYFRWKVLSEYGGVYLDADCEVLDGKVLHGIVEDLYAQDEYDCFFGVEEVGNGHPTAQTFGAKRGSDLVRFMVDLYENRLEPLWHWRETRGLIGPQLLSLYFRNRDINVADDGFFKNLTDPVMSAGAKVYPQKYFSPKFSLLGDALDYEKGSTCVYHMFANSNVDFRSNKRLQSARKQALTFAEYRAEIEKASRFPRDYHASHFSVRDGLQTAEGIQGQGNGLLMYGPYISLPGGEYVATVECLKRPRKGKAVLAVTAESGAAQLGKAEIAFASKAALRVPFNIAGKGANMCEITLVIDGVERIVVTNVHIERTSELANQCPTALGPPAVPAVVASRSSLKRIHRIYFGFDGKPDPFGRYLDTWKRQLPDFEIMHWNADNLPMDANDYVRQLYKEKDHAFLTDYFRWYLLREYGGSYFDADLEVVNGSIYSQLIEDMEASTSYDALIGIDESNGGWYTAHSMASKPGSELATFMCDVYDSFGKFTAWRKRGMFFWAPQLVGLYFSDRGFHTEGMGTMPHLRKPQVVERVKVYPQDYFSPLAPTGNSDKPFDLNGYSDNTALCHHFACSWHEEGSIYLSHSQEKGGQAKVLLRELAKAEGRQIVTEKYRSGALHMSFVPGGKHLLTQIGAASGVDYATTARAGYLVHGLSQPVTKGRYRVSFHLNRISRPGEITVQVTADGGARSIGEHTLTLPTDKSQGIVFCDVDIESDVDDLDCRLLVDEKCALFCIELTIDRITTPDAARAFSGPAADMVEPA
ncbi:glycosyltransferase family 32 protein [Novosphingobium resinovorum]|uniref:glycosyltransferase family 32 protein n=1 Tax=Novosphingobium resinovorum TaxID=158500 RepID=UPI002ED4FC4A|nr:glycosyltransferase [Novosphingobium resinovorum]